MRALLSGALRPARMALAAAAVLLLVSGCSVQHLVYVPGPAVTVSNFLLYLKIGSDESAWQMLTGSIKNSQPGLSESPSGDGYVANLGWKGYPTFKKQGKKDLKTFFKGTSQKVQKTSSTAASVVLVDKKDSSLAAGFQLKRVDNEWIIKQILITVPAP